MARFKDDQQVYALIGGMFEDVLADRSAGPRMRAIGGTVQWELRRPNARITVRLGDEVEHGVDCGQTAAKPEVVLSMDADTAHRFWAGELPMHVALSRGLIRAKGPVATILRIVPVVGPARDLYTARLEGGGEAPAPAPVETEAAADEPSETQVVAEVGAEGEAEAQAPAEPEADTPAEEPEPDVPAEAGVEPEVPAEAEAEAPAESEAGVPAEPEAPAEEPQPEQVAEPEPEPVPVEPVRTQPQVENADPEQTAPSEPDVPAGGEEITPP